MRSNPVSLALAGSVAALLISLYAAPATVAQGTPPVPSHDGPPDGALFQSADYCMTCHNRLIAPSGEDVSIGSAWRSSMMAHSSLDPYWQAAVRREVIDHPKAAEAIENECSRCHMPMAHVLSSSAGRLQTVFEHVPPVGGGPPVRPDPLALDGVSCALCHQITSDRLGQKDSFTGHFVVDTRTTTGPRPMFGPYEVDRGRTALMESAVGFQPTTSAHVQRSEVCATCHTLYTHTLDAEGKAIAEFPEQMPYQEWLHSDYRSTESCQDCHMPVVEQPMPIASVLGEPREGFSRHDFRGANFFMLGMLNRYRSELGVTAPAADLTAAAERTRAFLRGRAAEVSIADLRRADGRIEAEVVVRNLAGHKLPSAYPSRRAWLRVVLRDGGGIVRFSSGHLRSDGAIEGNDNDRDGSAFEPHYREVRSADQVQIYEAVMGDRERRPTTGLLSALTYLKDNRLTPKGFDKTTAPADVAVRGDASSDEDFAGGEDRVRYSMDVVGATGPFTVEVELWYQPIGFRWADNLRSYDAPETRRFVAYYASMASDTAALLARVVRTYAGP